ncbi:sugar phosphate isomerase/epimerase [Labedella gwakjiensis]|uniref:Sugar phosphate isomerase/epimerase n=1 Tax=Labedella gwakjiensis TaxID=390269 RepID=A0A2P8GU74_9MICO|nr:sugar phosphate isomerase/epimerase family protein [Labedella gwakjiensis]PSL37527.1 sugar phosphate isomerase/epimerase [Labedella gwakjiensis]RUQ84827.1 sugar phosphate isomerase/epimerase [Labedella gwakjiensis]
MAFKLAAQESTCEGDTLEEKFAFAQSVGFDGIELSGRGNGVFVSRIPELQAARAAAVVMPSAVAHTDHFIGDFDPEIRRGAIDELKDLLGAIAAAGGNGFVTPHAFGLFSRHLPPFTPPRSDEDSRRLLLEALDEVAAHAAGLGVVAYLEPLNRFEDFVVNTLADASWYVDEIGSPGLAVVADTWHMSIEESDTGAAIRAAGARIGHVQLGDSNRLEPGAGHYDWDDTLDALDDIGYEGWLAMECGLSGPARDVLPRVASLLRRE